MKLAVLLPKNTDEASIQVFKGLLNSARINPDNVGFFDSTEPLEESGATYVILAGEQPLQAFRPDLHPGLCHGRVMLVDLETRGALAFPVFHPESYRRHLRWQTVLLKELALFKEIGRADFWSWADFAPDTCVKCRQPKYDTDKNGVVYCRKHWATRLYDQTGTITADQAARMFEP